MSDKHQNPGQTSADADALRKRAEEQVRNMEQTTHSGQTSDEIPRILHELRVHQIELEMQNEELRNAQYQIEAGRARYFDLYDLAPVGYCTLSEKGLILEANLTAATLLGVSRSALARQPISRFIIKEDEDIFYLHRKKLFETGELQEFELRMAKPGGTIFWAHLTATTARSEDGSSVSRVVLSDITERKLSENILAFLAQSIDNQASGNFFQLMARHISETLDMGYVCIDRIDGDNLTAHSVAVYSSGKFEDNISCSLKHTPRAEVVGKDVCCFSSSIKKLFPSDAVLQQMEAESYIGVTLWSHGGCPIGLISVIGARPMTNQWQAESLLKLVGVRAAAELERKQAEEALKKSEKDLKESQRIAHVGSWRLDVATNQVVWTEELYNMYGFDPSLPPPPYTEHMKLFTPESWERLSSALARTRDIGVPYTLELETVRKDGKHGWMWVRGEADVDSAGKTIGLWGAAQDITERKQAEAEREKLHAELNQAQKMESVGRLAGGVAHDFNNMLGVIIGYAEMALEKVPFTEPLHADLEEILKAAERSANLTNQLLAFARKQHVIPKVIDLNDTIESMLTLLRRLIGEDIDLFWKPGKGLWPVMIDPGQVDQILANLCINARDAIAGVGKITIETNNRLLDEEYCARHAGIVPGEYVMMIVNDNGCGMDAETISFLFEPFFTTKGVRHYKNTVFGLMPISHQRKSGNRSNRRSRDFLAL